MKKQVIFTRDGEEWEREDLMEYAEGYAFMSSAVRPRAYDKESRKAYLEIFLRDLRFLVVVIFAEAEGLGPFLVFDRERGCKVLVAKGSVLSQERTFEALDSAVGITPRLCLQEPCQLK